MSNIYVNLLEGKNDVPRMLKLLEQLEADASAISTRKIRLDADISKIQNAIEKLKALKQNAENIKFAYKSDFSKLNSELTQLQEKARQLKQVIETKQKLGIDASQTEAELSKVQARINEIKAEKIQIKARIDEAQSKVNELQRLIKAKTEEQHELKLDLKNAEAELFELTSQSNRLNEELNKIPNTAQRISSAFMTISGLFGRIANLNPFTSILKIARGTVISRATQAIMSNVSGGVQRFDIVKSFKTIVPAMLKTKNASKQAEKAIDQLKESVLGLPTGLDEIVDSAKRFISTTGNIKKGTRLAIAANRAFLASGSDTQQQYYGTKQLQDLLSAGKLRTQEWESLEKSMPLAFRKIGEAMGYSGKKYGDFRSQLKTGQITAEEFLNTLEKIGNEGGELYKLAENYKDLMTAVISNVGNALKRGYEGILTELDKIFQEETGESLAKNLSGISTGIDRVFATITKYISTHKEDIMDFFNTLKELPIEDIVSLFGQYLKVWLDIINVGIKFANKNPKIAKAFLTLFVWSRILSKVFGGLGSVIGYFGNKAKKAGGSGGLFGPLIGKGNGKQLATGTGNLLNTLKKLAIGGAIIGEAELAVYGLVKIAQEIKKLGKMDWATAGENLLNMSGVIGIMWILLQKLGEFAGLEGLKYTAIGTGIVALADLAVYLTAKSFSEFAQSVKDLVSGFETLTNNDIDKDKILSNISDMTAVFYELMNLFPEDSTKFGQGSSSSWSIMQGRVTDMVRVTTELSTVATSLATISSKMGRVNTENILKIKDAIANVKDVLKGESLTGLMDKAKYLQDVTQMVKTSVDSIAQSAKNASGDLGFGGLKENIEGCISAIEELNGLSPVNISVKLKGKTALENAVDAIKRKLDTLPAIKTVSIVTNNTNTFTRKRYNPITKKWEYFSKGGFVKPVYRANGGPIFQPRGTDRVPAMLTAGEYVIKKSSVQGIGVDILQKLNNMNIAGAVKDLSVRAGINTSRVSNRSVSTVNNDNRKSNKVTINQNIREGKSAPFKAGRVLRTI